MLGLLKGMDAAAVRAFARANNIPVGSRGAPADYVYKLFFRAQVVAQLRRTGSAAIQLAAIAGPDLLRAAAKRGPRRAQ